jgi:erythromycin esterase-like protein
MLTLLLSAALAASPPLADGVWPLASMAFDAPLDDLDPLADILGDATFVGIGQAAHGSGGFDEAQARLFRWLVERHGVRVLAIESPWVWAEAGGDYVRTCQGDPVWAIRSVFPAFQDTSTAALLRWMCRWNVDHPGDPLSFLGFDIQQGADDARLLRRRLAELRFDAPDIAAGIGGCAGPDGRDPLSEDPDDLRHREVSHTPCIAALDGVDRFLADLPATEAVTWARIHARGLRAFEDEVHQRLADDLRGSRDARDAGMADVLLARATLEHPGARVAVMAHNAHLVSGAPAPWQPWEWTTVGRHLRARLGDSWAAVATIARDVEVITVPGHRSPHHPISSKRHLAVTFASDDRPLLLIDPARAVPSGVWRRVDEGSSARDWVQADGFDAVIALDRSRAALPPELLDAPPFEDLRTFLGGWQVKVPGRETGPVEESWWAWMQAGGCAADAAWTCARYGVRQQMEVTSGPRQVAVTVHTSALPTIFREGDLSDAVGQVRRIVGVVRRAEGRTWLDLKQGRVHVRGDPWTSSWRLNEDNMALIACRIDGMEEVSACQGARLAYSGG